MVSREIPAPSMTKEEILKDLKRLIMATVHDADKMRIGEDFFEEWRKTQTKVTIEARRLNQADNEWINKEYEKFLKDELNPLIEEHIKK